MKCLACGREFDGSTGRPCPSCGFPVYEILGSDLEGSLEQIRQRAKLHLEEYIRAVRIGLILYAWRDRDGILVRDSEPDPVFFAEGDDLRRGEVWYSRPLARDPEAETVTLTAAIRTAAEEWTVQVAVPNPQEPGLQQAGVRLEEGLTLRFLLKNQNGQTESGPVSLTAG